MLYLICTLVTALAIWYIRFSNMPIASAAMDMFAAKPSTDAASPTSEGGTLTDDNRPMIKSEGPNTNGDGHLTNGNPLLPNDHGPSSTTDDNRNLANDDHDPSSKIEKVSATGENGFLTNDHEPTPKIDECPTSGENRLSANDHGPSLEINEASTSGDNAHLANDQAFSLEIDEVLTSGALANDHGPFLETNEVSTSGDNAHLANDQAPYLEIDEALTSGANGQLANDHRLFPKIDEIPTTDKHRHLANHPEPSPKIDEDSTTGENDRGRSPEIDVSLTSIASGKLANDHGLSPKVDEEPTTGENDRGPSPKIDVFSAIDEDENLTNGNQPSADGHDLSTKFDVPPATDKQEHSIESNQPVANGHGPSTKIDEYSTTGDNGHLTNGNQTLANGHGLSSKADVPSATDEQEHSTEGNQPSANGHGPPTKIDEYSTTGDNGHLTNGNQTLANGHGLSSKADVPSATDEQEHSTESNQPSANGHGPPTKIDEHLATGDNGQLTNGNQTLANGHGLSSKVDVSSAISEGSNYWWLTSGIDLSRMLQEANYPEEAQRQFLDYYREIICPLLGGKPEKDSKYAAVGWDGNPFEYSFEFKGSTKKPGVRFVLDLSELRPENTEYPLSITNSEKVLDTLVKRSPMFDDTWVFYVESSLDKGKIIILDYFLQHRALARWFVYSHVPSKKQKALVAQVGYQTPTILGFDINARILEVAPGMLPVMAKSYFPPCFVAADRGFGRFQALCLGVRQMPDIGYYPNILLALKTIEDYVQDNPQYENCGRGMATDFVKAGKARLKVYMRYWGNSFDEMWDYYTLGGRIPNLDDDKEKLRDLIHLARGCDYPADMIKEETPEEQRRRKLFGQKPTSLYFSLSPDRPTPVPKLYFYPAFQAPNDQAIAQGLDAWLKKYEWYDGGGSVEERVQNVFTYRRLDEKPGIFTFIGIGRKEDSRQDGLSLQIYVTPELYETPRF